MQTLVVSKACFANSQSTCQGIEVMTVKVSVCSFNLTLKHTPNISCANGVSPCDKNYFTETIDSS